MVDNELLRKGKKLAKEGGKWLAVFLILTLLVIVFVQKGKLDKVPDEVNPPEEPVITVTPEAEITAETIREVIAPAAEMISYKYYYTDAGIFEKSKKVFDDKVKLPFTTKKAVYVYSGEIDVGIDLNDVAPEPDNEAKTITIKLPALEMLTHELDRNSFECYDVKNSVFTEIGLEDFNEFQKALMEQQEEKLSAKTEFWDSARAHTEEILTGLLKASGSLSDYTISYQWAD